jgi:hypothetical protein
MPSLDVSGIRRDLQHVTVGKTTGDTKMQAEGKVDG